MWNTREMISLYCLDQYESGTLLLAYQHALDDNISHVKNLGLYVKSDLCF